MLRYVAKQAAVTNPFIAPSQAGDADDSLQIVSSDRQSQPCPPTCHDLARWRPFRLPEPLSGEGRNGCPEAAIEAAIALLDRIDAPAEDREDEGDWEPWLAAPEGHPQQLRWCCGADDDREGG